MRIPSLILATALVAASAAAAFVRDIVQAHAKPPVRQDTVKDRDIQYSQAANTLVSQTLYRIDREPAW